MEFEKEFDKQFKCIQGDCAGGGHTYPTEEEPEGGQCQFCAEYLFPIKQFISTQIKKAKQEEKDRICKEMTGEYKIIKEGYSNELNDFGYNERIREEIEKAKTLLT